MMQAAVSAPLFSNDMTGFIKILAIIGFTVLLPLGALIVYFLKRGPDGAISELRGEMNGLGGRVNTVEQQNVRLSEQVASISAMIVNSQRDIMEAIRSSGEAQTRAAHSIEIQVARLEERNNLGECLAEFGRSIERLCISMTEGDAPKHIHVRATDRKT